MVNVENIVRTKKFEKEAKLIKNSDWKDKIKNKIRKIIENPDIGKPLKYDLHKERTVRVGHYRLIYSFKDKTLFSNHFI